MSTNFVPHMILSETPTSFRSPHFGIEMDAWSCLLTKVLGGFLVLLLCSSCEELEELSSFDKGQNIGQASTSITKREAIRILSERGHEKVVTITLPGGHSKETHDHPRDSDIVIISGNIRIVTDIREYNLRPGDEFQLDAHIKHSEFVGVGGVTLVAARDDAKAVKKSKEAEPSATETEAKVESEAGKEAETETEEKEITPDEIAIREALRESATGAERSGRYNIAVLHYRRLAENDPRDLDAALGFARNLRYTGASKDAVLFLKTVRVEHRNPAALHLELVKAQISAGFISDAEEELLSLESTSLENWEYYALWGIVYDHLKRFDEAQKFYAAAIGVSPGNVSVLNNLSFSLAQGGKLDEAISLLASLVNSEFSSVQLRQNLALFYGLKGDFESAERLAEQDLSPEISAGNLSAFQMLHE